MTFDEFVEALLKAGWVARNDAQHAHIRELWDDLCLRGLNIPMPNSAIRINADEWRETATPFQESRCAECVNGKEGAK